MVAVIRQWSPATPMSVSASKILHHPQPVKLQVVKSPTDTNTLPTILTAAIYHTRYIAAVSIGGYPLLSLAAEVKRLTPYVILSTRENVVCGAPRAFTEAPNKNKMLTFKFPT